MPRSLPRLAAFALLAALAACEASDTAQPNTHFNPAIDCSGLEPAPEWRSRCGPYRNRGAN
jgi:hypothetical protein